MCCNASPPPPVVDPGASQAAAASAAADLAFRTRVYEESKPAQDELRGLTRDVVTGQLQDAATARQRGNEQYEQYQSTFRPLEQQMAAEAMAYGGAADQESQAGRALSDVSQQSARARDISTRAMASMGINPNSGRFASMQRVNQAQEAATGAGMANNARTQARDKGISLRAGAAAFGRNQVNSSGQMIGLSGNAGNSAVANQNTSFMSGLPYASFQSGAYGNQIQAAGLGNQAAIANASNATSMANNASNNSGQMIGTVVGAAATMF